MEMNFNTEMPERVMEKLATDVVSRSLEEMPEFGYYTSMLADEYKKNVTSENVEGVIMGAAVVAMLTQEALAYSTMMAAEARERAMSQENPDGVFASTGAIVAIKAIAEAVTAVTDMVAICADEALTERAFNDIVSGFRGE